MTDNELTVEIGNKLRTCRKEALGMRVEIVKPIG